MKYIKVVVPISLCVGIALLLVCTFLPYGNKDEIDSSLASSKGEVITSRDEIVSSNGEVTSKGEVDTSKGVVITSRGEIATSKGEVDSHTSIPQQEDSARTEIGKPQSFDLTGLSKKAVSWGPGREVDEENKPTACVSLNEKYSKYGAIFLMNEDKIYLSFDLGYEAGYTNKILDVLKENGVKAIFFVTENYAEAQDKLLRRIIDEGHTVGSHSVTHPNIPSLSSQQAKSEIEGVNVTLKEKYDYTAYLFRFPAGTFSEESLAIASNCGFHSVFWSFAYKDWDNSSQPANKTALERLTGSLHKGGVYLLHPMKTNSEVLSDFIKAAREKGFQFGVL